MKNNSGKYKNKNWILFINYNAYPCIVGGLEIFNFHLINELSKSYDTHVLTFCNDYNGKGNLIVHKIKNLRFSKFTTPLSTFLFIMKNRKRIKLIHISYTFDFWSHFLVIVLVKKILSIKYIVTIHDGNLAKWIPNWPYRIFFKNASKITGVSDRIVTEYEKRSNRNDLIFTPPLIPFNVVTPKKKFIKKWSINADDQVLLYVGSLKPLKSVNTLIEALGIISSKKLKNYKLKVLIAGDGISKNELEDQVCELNLQDNVQFLGNVKTELVSELYNLADIYTICSEYEGLPISTLEAFANNLPCITSDAPGLINISENNKNTILFKTKDSYEYASKIELVLNDFKIQEKLKTNGNNYYKSLFSYDKLVNNFKEIIDKI